MKKLILILATLFLFQAYYCQAPQKINYQAVVRDAIGNTVSNTSIPVSISIGSCNVYSGNVTTNNNGLINLELNLSNCSINRGFESGLIIIITFPGSSE